MPKDYSSLSIKDLKQAVIAYVGIRGLEEKRFCEKSEFVKFLTVQDEIANYKSKGQCVIEPGKYILGDPCYVALDVIDLEKFNETYFEDDDEDAQDKGVPRFNDSTPVIAFNTADSEPAWYTSKDDTYSFQINGGVIVIVSLTYNPKFEENENAHIVEFTEPTKCFAKNGIIHFGNIVLDTNKTKKRKSINSINRKSKPNEYKVDDFVVDEDENEHDTESTDDDDDEEEEEWTEDESEEEREKERKRRIKKEIKKDVRKRKEKKAKKE